MKELIEDECHWCEVRITRMSENLLWIDDYESADCEFHPAAFDARELKSTGESAPHQPIREVHQIITEHHFRTKQQRNRGQRLRLVETNKVMLSSQARRTSIQAAEKLLPRTGTIRRAVFEAITSRSGLGMTDYELEQQLGGKHQTVSAVRRSLVLDGLIRDSGYTRANPQGNQCIVWVPNYEYEQAELLDANA